MNDVIYNEAVTTPGYEPEFAVGTTYSLEEQTFMAIALSFAGLGEFTDADLQSPFRLLEGVRRANNRIALFCNRGGLAVPKRKNMLTAMLDKSVFEVADDRLGHELANFHPKIWVIKERCLECREKRQIKLIVLSRNLTKDTSLDVAAVLTAPLSGGSESLRAKHAPLKELLLRLAEKAGAKSKKIRRLARDIDSLGAFELEHPYVDYDFLPIHFGKSLNPLIDFKQELPAERMMVVSPFIDPETLTWLNSFRPAQEKVLITRLDSLTPEIMQLYAGENAEVWTMSPIAEQNDVQPMNLHAKMYYSWRPTNGGVHLWLGSANATQNGFYRNSEFLLRLTYKRGQNQFQAFKSEFCDDSKQLCQKIDSLPTYAPESTDHSISIAVRKWLISRGNLSAEVFPADSGFEVSISAKRFEALNATVSIAPMQTPDRQVFLSSESLEGRVHIADKSDLCEFYILTVTPFDNTIESIRIVIKIPTKGIPQDRDDSIFRSILDTREKFLRYVEMMISDHPLELTALMSQTGGKCSSVTRESSASSTPLYESLLKIAATDPHKLNDIQGLTSKLADGVVPDSFKQLCATFQTTIKKLK